MLFDQIWDSCFDVKVWNVEPEWKPIFEIGFNGLLKKTKEGPKFKKSQVSWAGTTRRDGTIDEAARLKSTQAVFSKLFHYHTGRTSAYLGTLLNALCEAEIICQAWGLSKELKRPDDSDPELLAQYKANRETQKRFSDSVDTFIQVLVTLGTKGAGSVAGRQWQKAIYG